MFERFRQSAPHSSPTFLCAKAPSIPDVNGHRSRCESKTFSNTSSYTARSNMHMGPYLELHRRENDHPISPRGHVPLTAAARDPRARPRQQSRHHQQARRGHSPWEHHHRVEGSPASGAESWTTPSSSRSTSEPQLSTGCLHSPPRAGRLTILPPDAAETPSGSPS